MSKSKCTKHTMFGPLLEVEMSKKCTPVVRSKFRSQNVQNTPCLDHFWKLRCRKSARLWCEAHFEVKMLKKNTRGSDHFWTFRCRFAWQAQGVVHLVKSEQNVRFWNISKNHGRRGTFAEDLQRSLFRGRRSTRDMFIRSVRRSGR